MDNQETFRITLDKTHANGVLHGLERAMNIVSNLRVERLKKYYDSETHKCIDEVLAICGSRLKTHLDDCYTAPDDRGLNGNKHDTN